MKNISMPERDSKLVNRLGNTLFIESLLFRNKVYKRSAILFLTIVSLLASNPNQTNGQSAQYGHAANWSSNTKLRSMALHPIVKWNHKIGEGRSQVVGGGERIYITVGSSEKRKSDKTATISQTIFCLNAKTGEEIWQYVSSGIMDPDQETFGGAKATPRSTTA